MRSQLTAAVVHAPIMVKKHGAALLCQDAKLRDVTCWRSMLSWLADSAARRLLKSPIKRTMLRRGNGRG
jgi:hypothetical protein